MEKLRLDLMHKNASFGRGAMLPIEREIYTFSSAAKIEPNGNRSQANVLDPEGSSGSVKTSSKAMSGYSINLS
jgi:hypothetical protein